MTFRSVVLVLLSVFAAVFVILNWAGITAPVPVNLLFQEMQAPLGLILLVVLGAMWCVGIVWSLMQQASTLMEVRRAYKQATANKDLADHAERSRIEQVKVSMAEEFKGFEAKLLETLTMAADARAKNAEDAKVRFEALEKNVSDLQKSIESMEKVSLAMQQTVEKLAEKVKVEPVEVEPEEPAPEPKKGFFSFLSSKSEPVAPKAEEVKPAEPVKQEAKAETADKEPAAETKDVAAQPETQKEAQKETPAQEESKQGFFKKMFG